MVTVEHSLIVRCDTVAEFEWALSKLQQAVNDPANPIQAISPFLQQKRINVTFVTKQVEQ